MNMNFKNVMAAAVVAVITAVPSVGQDDGFDLSSQRGEVQEFNPVNGHKIDHKGLVINPTPQSINRPFTGILNASGGFKVKDRKKSFADDLDFLKQSSNGLLLEIDYGNKPAKKAGVKAVEGAYVLNIGPKNIKITGYDERGAFYGLQTLRQILSSEVSRDGNDLPMMVINDYPSMKYRGVVEGFYGTPWSHEVRKSLIEFYGRNKMNDYLYGPKDDPYHSSPYWRQPYPEYQAENIHELVEAARKARVNFIWAIHPGKDIRWNKEDYDSLVNKFNMMYDLGVRSFAIFFDDIEGEGTNPKKQVELLNSLTDDFVKAKGDVTNLIVCPTDYSQLWAKPGPDGPLAVYGRELNPNVEVFWTGAVVCSDLTPETLEFVDSRIKRPALYWWNYPVTDYCKHILMQGPVYGLDTNLTSEQVAGIESNPMEHGEASKLALYGVADYAWNTSAYNPIDNWERGLVELMPGAADAYRTFAIHSTDTETGYRRDESWETTVFPYNNYTTEQFNVLRNEFEKIVKVENEIRKNGNSALVKEMSPWLVQFTKLGQRGLRTLDLIKTYEAGNDSVFWTDYLANVMSESEFNDYNAHKIGTMKLQPFYEKNMDGMVGAFYKKLTGRYPAMYGGVGTYANLRTNQIKLMLDGDSTTFYTSAYSQAPGDWIGVDLQAIRPVSQVNILQGRNSVDDGDYYSNVILECSSDGKAWKPLTDAMQKAYVINWKGDSAVDARYVRLRRMDNDSKSWAAVREFTVTVENVDRDAILEQPFGAGMLKAFDENPTTSYALQGTVGMNRLEKNNQLVVLCAEPKTPLAVKQFDNKGKELSIQSVTTPYVKIMLDPVATKITLSGSADIYEIIQK